MRYNFKEAVLICDRVGRVIDKERAKMLALMSNKNEVRPFGYRSYKDFNIAACSGHESYVIKEYKNIPHCYIYRGKLSPRYFYFSHWLRSWKGRKYTAYRLFVMHILKGFDNFTIYETQCSLLYFINSFWGYMGFSEYQERLKTCDRLIYLDGAVFDKKLTGC